jgi:hypothetical protein
MSPQVCRTIWNQRNRSSLGFIESLSIWGAEGTRNVWVVGVEVELPIWNSAQGATKVAGGSEQGSEVIARVDVNSCGGAEVFRSPTSALSLGRVPTGYAYNCKRSLAHQL